MRILHYNVCYLSEVVGEGWNMFDFDARGKF